MTETDVNVRKGTVEFNKIQHYPLYIVYGFYAPRPGPNISFRTCIFLAISENRRNWSKCREVEFGDPSAGAPTEYNQAIWGSDFGKPAECREVDFGQQNEKMGRTWVRTQVKKPASCHGVEMVP